MSQNHNGTNANPDNTFSFFDYLGLFVDSAGLDEAKEAFKTANEKDAQREASMSHHPAGKGRANTTTHVVVDGNGIGSIFVQDHTVAATPDDTLSEFAADLLWTVESILSNRVGKGALLPYEGEQLFEDTELLDHAENVGLVVEDHNKSVFMFDESFVDSEENLAFAWFAWGDTLPSYPVFPVRVIRTP